MAYDNEIPYGLKKPGPQFSGEDVSAEDAMAFFAKQRKAQEPVVPVEEEVEDDDFMRGFKSTFKETAGLAYGVSALQNAAMGDAAERDADFAKYQEWMDAAAKYDVKDGKKLYSWDYLSGDQSTVGDWLDATQYYLGAGAANLLQGGGAAAVGKQAFKVGAKKLIKEVAKESLAKKATQGALVGVGLQSAVSGFGETYGQAGEVALATGGSLDDVDLGRVAVAGTASTALEFAGDLFTLGAARVFKGGMVDEVLNAATKPLASMKGKTGSATRAAVRGATAAVGGAATEAPTEVAQTIVQRWGAGQEIDFNDREFINELKESGFAGAMAGGGIAGATRAILGRSAKEEDRRRGGIDVGGEDFVPRDAVGPDGQIIEDQIEDQPTPAPSKSLQDVINDSFNLPNEADLTDDERAQAKRDGEKARKQAQKEITQVFNEFFDTPSGQDIITIDPETQTETVIKNATIGQLRDHLANLQAEREAVIEKAQAPVVEDSPAAPATVDIIEQQVGLKDATPVQTGKQRAKTERELGAAIRAWDEEVMLDSQGKPMLVKDPETQVERPLTRREYMDSLAVTIQDAVDTFEFSGTAEQRTTKESVEKSAGVKPEPTASERSKRAKELGAAFSELDAPSGLFVIDKDTQVEVELTVGQATNLWLGINEAKVKADTAKAINPKGKTIDVNNAAPTIVAKDVDGNRTQVSALDGSMESALITKIKDIKAAVPAEKTTTPAENGDKPAVKLSQRQQEVLDFLREAAENNRLEELMSSRGGQQRTTALSPETIAKAMTAAGNKITKSTVDSAVKKLREVANAQFGGDVVAGLREVTKLRTQQQQESVQEGTEVVEDVDVLESEAADAGLSFTTGGEGQTSQNLGDVKLPKWESMSKAQREYVNNAVNPAADTPEAAMVKAISEQYEADTGKKWAALSVPKKYEKLVTYIDQAKQQQDQAGEVKGVTTQEEAAQIEAEAQQQNDERQQLVDFVTGSQIGQAIQSVFDNQIVKALGIPSFSNLDFGYQFGIVSDLLRAGAIIPTKDGGLALGSQPAVNRVLIQSGKQIQQETANERSQLESGTTEQTDGQRSLSDDTAAQEREGRVEADAGRSGAAPVAEPVPEKRPRISIKRKVEGVDPEVADTISPVDENAAEVEVVETPVEVEQAREEIAAKQPTKPEGLTEEESDIFDAVASRDLVAALAAAVRHAPKHMRPIYERIATMLLKQIERIEAAGGTVDMNIASSLEEMQRASKDTDEGTLGLAAHGAGDGFVGRVFLRSYTTENLGTGLTAETLLHELVHITSSTTLKLVENGRLKDKDIVRAAKDLNQMRTILRNNYRKILKENPAWFEENGINQASVEQAVYSTYELISYALTSESVQKFAELTEAVVTKNKPSFTEKFFQAIAKLLGGKYLQGRDLMMQNNALKDIMVSSAAEIAFNYDAGQSTAMFAEALNQQGNAIEPITLYRQGEQGAIKEEADSLVYDESRSADFKTMLREKQLGWMTLSQIADRAKNAAVDSYLAAVNAMQRTSKARTEKAHVLNGRWSALEDNFGEAVVKTLNEVMIRATRAQYDPSSVEDTSNTEKAAKNQTIQTMFDGLPNEAKSLFQDVRDHFQDDFNTKFKLMEDAINDAAAAGKDVTKLKEDLKAMRQLKGPYFPLKRLGGFYAVGMSTELRALMDKKEAGTATEEELKQIKAMRRQGKHYMVTSHTSLSEANKAANKYIKTMGSGYRNKASEHFANLRKELPGLAAIEDYLDKDSNLSKEARAEVSAMLAYMYADMMPESSGLKSEMRRENIAGADEDMRQVFAHQAIINAHQISRLTHAREMSQAMTDLNKLGAKGDLDAELLKQELQARNSQNLTFDSSPMIDALMTASYFAHLGLSPAYILTNLSQVPMITAPVLGARYGSGKASSAMWSALTDASEIISTNWMGKGDPDSPSGWRMEFDWTTKFNERSGESRMLQELLERNLLDVTIEHDLSAVAKGSAGSLSRGSEYVQMANTVTRVSEMLNRSWTALAAYRLETQKLEAANETKATPLTAEEIHEQASKMAVRMVNETQLDYSGVNAPRYMQSFMGSRSIAKVMFQFRKYQQGMLYLLTKNIYDGFRNKDISKEERAIARKTLLGLAMTTGTMAGTVGLPFVGTLAWWFNMAANMFAEDDEPFDVETWYRNWLTDQFGATMATAITKGLPAAAGVDISKRIGMGDIASVAPFIRQQDTAKGTAKEVLFNLAGAPVSYVANAYDGITEIADGDVLRGIEKVVPLKVAQNMARAYRYSEEGMTDSRGEPIFEADQFSPVDLMIRAAGFSTQKESMYYDAMNVMMRKKTAVEDKRSELMREFAQAALANDFKEKKRIRAEINAFNKRHNFKKGIRIDNRSLNTAIKNRRKGRQERTEIGIRGGKQYQPYMEEVRFATEGG